MVCVYVEVNPTSGTMERQELKQQNSDDTILSLTAAAVAVSFVSLFWWSMIHFVTRRIIFDYAMNQPPVDSFDQYLISKDD